MYIDLFSKTVTNSLDFARDILFDELIKLSKIHRNGVVSRIPGFRKRHPGKLRF